MKKYSSLTFCFVLLVNTAFGLPLVFKTQKEISADGITFVEIATADVSKYNQVRVGVVYIINEKNIAEKWEDSTRYIRLEAVEESDIFFIESFFVTNKLQGRSIVVENPPTKIRFSAIKSGIYRIYVWAQ